LFFYVVDFLTIVIGIVRIGIRLFGLTFDGVGDEIISFDTDRRIVIVVDGFKFVHGIDDCVFVLLNDDVEPPVDVDWRCKVDGEPYDERRFVDSGGLVRGFVVGGGTIGIKRCVRDWMLVVSVVFDGGAVAGRVFEGFIFPFDDEAFAIVCLLRDGAIRGGTLVIGIKICNDLNEGKIDLWKQKFTFGGFFFSSVDSLIVAGGLIIIIGFFFTTAAGFGGVVSSFLLVEISTFVLSSAGFFEIVIALTDEATVFIRSSEVVERGSPLRLSRIDFSAYSLT
jgi:hypothetical protein